MGTFILVYESVGRNQLDSSLVQGGKPELRAASSSSASLFWAWGVVGADLSEPVVELLPLHHAHILSGQLV